MASDKPVEYAVGAVRAWNAGRATPLPEDDLKGLALFVANAIHAAVAEERGRLLGQFREAGRWAIADVSAKVQKAIEAATAPPYPWSREDVLDAPDDGVIFDHIIDGTLPLPGAGDYPKLTYGSVAFPADDVVVTNQGCVYLSTDPPPADDDTGDYEPPIALEPEPEDRP
jgi:hypothetical protein